MSMSACLISHGWYIVRAQWATKQPSSMLLSVPFVIISTLGVISFLRTRFIFSSIASSLSASLSGSVPDSISPYSYPQHQHPPLGHTSYHSSVHSRYRTPAQSAHSRTKRSSSEMLLSNILNKLVSSQLCLRNINLFMKHFTLGMLRTALMPGG